MFAHKSQKLLKAIGPLMDILRVTELPRRGFLLHSWNGPVELVPELAVRTKGEKPSKPGDSLGGAPDVVVPAGDSLAEIAEELPAPEDTDATPTP